MKKLFFLFLASTTLSGCWYVSASPNGTRVVVEPTPVVVTAPPVYNEVCAYQPNPYPNFLPVEASGPSYNYCETWGFQYYSGVYCEETWCNYNDGCGWNFEYESCY